MNNLSALHNVRLPVAILLMLAMVPVALAEPPSILAMFRKKQPLSDKALELKAEHGPWLILAATLSGEDAQQKATDLANEIQASMKLASFVMHKSSHVPETLGVGQRVLTDEQGNLVPKQLKLKYANGSSDEAFAVLVGEFSSDKDPRIEDTLTAIRSAQPKALGAEGIVQNTRKLFWWQSSRKDNLTKGPMGAAFLTRNPLLPDDFFLAPQMEEFVIDLNKQVDYSLLEAPGRFTVRVASFHGQAVTNFGGESNTLLGDPTDSLEIAAASADKMTRALRAKGVEAYQYHDRYGSYVTIGSFEDLGQELVTGGFKYNSAMLLIMNEHCGYREIDTKDPRTGAISKRTSLKSIDKIPFDADGKPMAIPRPATRNLYNGSKLGQR